MATQDAVIRIIDVAIDDVAGAITGFPLPHEVRDGPHDIEVLRFKQSERVRLGNAFARRDLVIKVAQFAPLDKELHVICLPD